MFGMAEVYSAGAGVGRRTSDLGLRTSAPEIKGRTPDLGRRTSDNYDKRLRAGWLQVRIEQPPGFAEGFEARPLFAAAGIEPQVLARREVLDRDDVPEIE